mmetsp:Transcript_39386/g.77493  ORF Transcript_39386/g.77493 Transcript_39386/m.77493 type:complete len:408 (-) Transcript_39386:121-1344(-)
MRRCLFPSQRLLPARLRKFSSSSNDQRIQELELRVKQLEQMLAPSIPQMKYRQLGNTDLRVSAVSLGCAGLGGVYGGVDQDQANEIVLTALRRGINFFDTSPYYGDTLSETVLGKCFQHALSTGEFKRSDFYIATKVGRYGSGADFSGARVEASIQESLDRLQTDSLDLVQCHDIEFASSLDQVVHEALPALFSAKAAGKVRHVGITGLPLSVIDYVLEQHDGPAYQAAGRPRENMIDTILSYCCYTLNNTGLEAYLPRWKHRGIGIIQGGATSMGLLTPGGPQDWHPAPDQVRLACREAVELCERLGEDAVKLAFQYTYSQPDIATVLVGTISKEAVETNLQWTSTPPNPDLVAEVQEILAPIRNKLWVEKGSEENIALSSGGFWAGGRQGQNVIAGVSRNLDNSK